MRPGIEALQTLGLLAAFSPSRLAALSEQADLVRTGPDEVLFRQGDRLAELHILLSGQVAETYGRAADEVLTGIVTPVSPLALASAMLREPATTGARTITSARLIILPIEPLQAMIDAEPGLALPFLAQALSEMRRQAAELCDMKLRSSMQRLAAFLLDLVQDPAMNPARFVLPYEKRYLAARIGCSQENLSRAFASLRRFGVETQRGIVVLRDVTALRALVEPVPVVPEDKLRSS